MMDHPAWKVPIAAPFAIRHPHRLDGTNAPQPRALGFRMVPSNRKDPGSSEEQPPYLC